MCHDFKMIIVVGDCLETLELCHESGQEILAVIADRDPGVAGVAYWGDQAAAREELRRHPKVPLVMAEIHGPRRRELVELLQREGRVFVGVVHPAAQVSENAEIGAGSVIHFGVYVGAGARLGAFARLEVGATVMGRARVEGYVTLGPRSLVLANARIAVGETIAAADVITS